MTYNNADHNNFVSSLRYLYLVCWLIIELLTYLLVPISDWKNTEVAPYHHKVTNLPTPVSDIRRL